MFRLIAIRPKVGSSGRQRVQQGVSEELEITVPSLEEQKEIGSILSAIDAKNAVNEKINDYLAA